MVTMMISLLLLLLLLLLLRSEQNRDLITDFEYYFTCDTEGQIIFHVEASKSTPMRLKMNDLIIHADDEGLSLELLISQESDQLVIEHYVRDVLIRRWY